jgi:hypothetical protein
MHQHTHMMLDCCSYWPRRCFSLDQEKFGMDRGPMPLHLGGPRDERAHCLDYMPLSGCSRLFLRLSLRHLQVQKALHRNSSGYVNGPDLACSRGLSGAICFLGRRWQPARLTRFHLWFQQQPASALSTDLTPRWPMTSAAACSLLTRFNTEHVTEICNGYNAQLRFKHIKQYGDEFAVDYSYQYLGTGVVNDYIADMARNLLIVYIYTYINGSRLFTSFSKAQAHWRYACSSNVAGQISLSRLHSTCCRAAAAFLKSLPTTPALTMATLVF